MPTQLQALKALADTEQNPDLLRLERLLSRFNLFEAVGAVRHELRHSDFLAFLLDPSRSHGLGAAFLHSFLRAALDLDGIDFSRAYVLREWHHIDILIIDEASRFAVIIENKIDTGEHSDQLNRYQTEILSHYPGYRAVALYLTPDGDAPTSPDYQAISYTLVCKIIEQTTRDNAATLDAEVFMALEHYTQMLRRHIVSDSDVAKLCRSLYKQHKQALDLVFEHVVSQEKQIWEYTQLLIQQTETVYLGAKTKRYMTFGLREWKAAGLFTSPPHIYLEFQEFAAGLRIYLTLSPGDPVYRAKVFKAAQKADFPGCQSSLTTTYCRLADIAILCEDDYDLPLEEIQAIILRKWTGFLRDDLLKITETIRKEKWLWDTP